MRQASRSGDAPSDTRSGDGQHRPTTTRVIVVGIGPSRPDRRPGGVRVPAPTFPDRAPDARRRTVERKRATRVPTTVRDTQLSTSSGNRTHSRSVFRNGVRLFRPMGGHREKEPGTRAPTAPHPLPPTFPPAMSRFYRSRHCTSAVSSSGQSPSGGRASRTSAEHRHLHRYGSSTSPQRVDHAEEASDHDPFHYDDRSTSARNGETHHRPLLGVHRFRPWTIESAFSECCPCECRQRLGTTARNRHTGAVPRQLALPTSNLTQEGNRAPLRNRLTPTSPAPRTAWGP
ncbi:hypothetical protein SALBM311S_12884 [Streptomyces alboniger]